MPAQPRARATGAPLQRRMTELPLAAFGRNLQMTKRWPQLVSYHSKKLVACATVAQGDHCQIRRTVSHNLVMPSPTSSPRQEDRFHIAVRFHTRLIKTLDNMLNYSVNESKILDSEVVLGCLEFVSCSRSALLIKTLRWTQMSGRAISRSAYSVIFDLVSLHTFTKKSPDLMLRNCASECSTASMQPETVAVVSNEPLHAGWPSFPSVRQSIYPRDTSNYGACLLRFWSLLQATTKISGGTLHSCLYHEDR